MAKKKKTIEKYQKKKIRVDPLYRSYWFSKFINKFLKNGKKHIVIKIFYNSFTQLKKKFRRLPVRLLFLSLLKLKPIFSLVSKRFGKQWKKIPTPLEPRRQYIIALTWLVLHTKTESDENLEQRLIRVFSNLFLKKTTVLTKHRNTYFQEIQQHRINHKFRWK